MRKRSPPHWAVHCSKTGKVRCWVEGSAKRALAQCRLGETATRVPAGARGSHVHPRSGELLQKGPRRRQPRSGMEVQVLVPPSVKIKRLRLRDCLDEPGFMSRVMEHLIKNGILDDMEL